MGGACSAKGGEEEHLQVTGWKARERKRALGRQRRKWIDNIKMDLLEIGLGDLDWINLAQDRYRWRALVTIKLFQKACF
jgi:hypothetical protein